MRFVPFAVFILVAILLDAGAHAYLWMRLIRDPGWPGTAQWIATWVVVGLAIYLPMGWFASRMLPRNIGAVTATGSFLWMGSILFLVVLFFSVDVVKWIFMAGVALWDGIGNGDHGPDPLRREMLARGAAGAVGVASIGFSSVAIRTALAEVDVREVEVPLARLPSALSGLTIVQLTDMHVGPTIGKSFVDQVVRKANAQKPDVVVITGDLVDGSISQLRDQIAPLAGLQSRYGTYFVTGNHEYYSGAVEWTAQLRAMGVRVLSGERIEIGDRAASFDLVGIDDFTDARIQGGYRRMLARALAGRDPERELVLLAHQPKAVQGASEHGVGLQLSGHTHGGQIWPFGMVVALAQPYVSGLHRHGDHTQIYVSCGTGYWGPPMRFGAPAEITRLVLTRG